MGDKMNIILAIILFIANLFIPTLVGGLVGE
jgi:hypothetical protein